jgi:multidrug resistance protein, MATE family
VTLAANQVLMQFLSITAHALDGFAFAAEALVGQAVGARARGRLRRAAVLTAHLGGSGRRCDGAGLPAGGGGIIDLMTTSGGGAGRWRGTSCRGWSPRRCWGLASWMLDGIFIGATRTRDMRNMMAVSASRSTS